MEELRILLARQGKDDSRSIDGYIADGGYKALEKALKEMTPDEVIEEVFKSNVRGRGGAAFPTGRKWKFLPKDAKTRYLCVNADESEPGTCKDRQIMEDDPHLLVEGTVVACYAIQAERAYIYIRGEYPQSIRILEREGVGVRDASIGPQLDQGAAPVGARRRLDPVQLGRRRRIPLRRHLHRLRQDAVLEGLRGERGQTIVRELAGIGEPLRLRCVLSCVFHPDSPCARR